MASNLIRNLPKSYRQTQFGVKLQQSRNASTNGPSATSQNLSAQQPRPTQTVLPPQQPQIIAQESSGTTKVAIGLALGLSLSLFMKNSLLDRFFPANEAKKEEKVVPTIDPKLMEHIISQDRKVNQLENLLANVREELHERNNQQQSNQAPAQSQQRASNGDVFELSEIIQANNLAQEARHVKDLDEQRRLMIREHMLKLEGEILKVENKYRPTINKIRELEAHLESQRQIQQKEAPARLLWLSCSSLLDRLRDAPKKPLEKEPAYEVLKQFAANDNQLAISILDAIPPKVLKEGVQSEETLSERFQRLDRVCKRVAMVDSHGAGLGKYLLSYIQSLFIIDRSQPITDEEVRGELLVDPTKWTTFDILARVRYCLGRKNLEQAVRYANQLRGQARVAARDWIRDARLHLVTRQALSALLTHAEAIAVDTTATGVNNATDSATRNFAS